MDLVPFFCSPYNFLPPSPFSQPAFKAWSLSVVILSDSASLSLPSTRHEEFPFPIWRPRTRRERCPELLPSSSISSASRRRSPPAPPPLPPPRPSPWIAGGASEVARFSLSCHLPVYCAAAVTCFFVSRFIDVMGGFWWTAGIQSTISRINPELLKSVIASTSLSAPPTPKVEGNALPPLPVYVPVLRYFDWPKSDPAQ